MKRAGRLLGSALCLAGLVALAVFVESERVLGRRYASPGAKAEAAWSTRPVDAGLLERGRHLVHEVAQCGFCHGTDLAGREMADDPWIGRLHAPNLTRGAGGIGAALEDRDWDRALRRGVARDGRSLLLMPAGQLTRLSDHDLAAIVAFLKRIPAVDREWPERRAGWLTRVVVALGLAPDLLAAAQVEALEPREASSTGPLERARSVEREGEYLVALGSCRVCHRADLAGGLHPLSLPGEPVPPDLTPSGPLAAWRLADFARAMREGRTPDGRQLDREFMPWPAFAGLDDREIEAIWLYLRGLEGAEGDRSTGPTSIARRPSEGRSG